MEKTRGFDRVKLVAKIGKGTEYSITETKFPFDWILEGKQTVVLRLMRHDLVVYEKEIEIRELKES